MLRTASNSGDLIIPTSTNAESLGFKVLDYKLELSGEDVVVTSKTDKVVQVTATGSSIAENRTNNQSS